MTRDKERDESPNPEARDAELFEDSWMDALAALDRDPPLASPELGSSILQTYRREMPSRKWRLLVPTGIGLAAAAAFLLMVSGPGWETTRSEPGEIVPGESVQVAAAPERGAKPNREVERTVHSPDPLVLAEDDGLMTREEDRSMRELPEEVTSTESNPSGQSAIADQAVVRRNLETCRAVSVELELELLQRRLELVADELQLAKAQPVRTPDLPPSVEPVLRPAETPNPGEPVATSAPNKPDSPVDGMLAELSDTGIERREQVALLRLSSLRRTDVTVLNRDQLVRRYGELARHYEGTTAGQLARQELAMIR